MSSIEAALAAAQAEFGNMQASAGDNLAQAAADDLRELLNAWHAENEVWDRELDQQIAEWRAKKLAEMNENPQKPKQPYFSPSSGGSDPRELVLKILGSKRDKAKKPAYQGRWQRLGTATGDYLQRDILFIEKHAEKVLGYPSRFKFERTEEGYPMFEEYAQKNLPVHYKERLFYLYGLPDGILEYVTDDGEIVRIGLEIKSKQTTYAQTGEYSMRTPDPKHVDQCVVYSMMYGVSHYIILYANASKKGWFQSDEDVQKYPDLRTFGVHITEQDQLRILDKFADVVKASETGVFPLPDLTKWTFNNYKEATALSLNEREVEALHRSLVEISKDYTLKPYEKSGAEQALAQILDIRRGAGVLEYGT